MYSVRKIRVIFLLLLSICVLHAQIPAGYYNNATGKKGAALKTALYQIIRPHTVLEYYSSSTSFLKTDWNPEGYIWDMYSNYKRTYWTGMNREHSLPKSWWSSSPETTVAYSDLHNLYPSDATANMAKSNFPLGVVTGTPSFTNGVVKVGTNSYPGYTGEVFEPANEYKGDFARDYMYIVTCYEEYANNWRSTGTTSMLLNGSTYPVFRPYAINLLLEWCRNDPVSEKEIVRNNEVYKLQGNRNPYIDFPALSEYVWGKYVNEKWEGDESVPDIENNFYLNYNRENNTLFVKVSKPQSAAYYIYSVTGVLMLHSDTIAGDQMIDVSALGKGIYIIKLYTGTKRISAKFVIG